MAFWDEGMEEQILFWVWGLILCLGGGFRCLAGGGCADRAYGVRSLRGVKGCNCSWGLYTRKIRKIQG